MTDLQWLIFAATILGACGLWLVLPRGTRRGRRLGALVGLVALGLFGAVAVRWADPASEAIFGVLAAVTLLAAVSTVASKDPIYAAIWFALVLLGTAGLFLYQGAQFLGLATVVVYAGAILVTFLFVLMLAQPEGHARYDRVSWEPLVSAATGAVLVGVLTMVVANSLRAAEPVEAARESDLLAADHVARLGSRLFSEHLIAVEVVSAILLVALVGAAAIVLQGLEARGDAAAGHGRPTAAGEGGGDA